MADTILTNQANFSGLYGDDECPIEFSTNIVSATIVKGLTATKTANKKCWVDGPLTYTITVRNETGSVVTGGMMMDYLDSNVVILDSIYGIFINGVPTTNYTFAADILSVNLPTMEDGKEVIITFHVMQK